MHASGVGKDENNHRAIISNSTGGSERKPRYVLWEKDWPDYLGWQCGFQEAPFLGVQPEIGNDWIMIGISYFYYIKIAIDKAVVI